MTRPYQTPAKEPKETNELEQAIAARDAAVKELEDYRNANAHILDKDARKRHAGNGWFLLLTLFAALSLTVGFSLDGMSPSKAVSVVIAAILFAVGGLVRQGLRWS